MINPNRDIIMAQILVELNIIFFSMRKDLYNRCDGGHFYDELDLIGTEIIILFSIVQLVNLIISV